MNDIEKNVQAAQSPTDTQTGNHPLVDWSEVTLTHRCNQRCFFCYEEARDIASDPSLDEIRRLFVETKKHAELVVLCGKEVLLRKDILEIIRSASSLGLKVAVFSNGQALSKPDIVEQIVEAGCTSLVVSFHFPDEEVFARGARVQGKRFGKILEGLQKVRDYNLTNPDRQLPVSTESDMFALNLGRLSDMRQTLLDCFGDSPWKMRVGSLVPTKIYDLGLEHVLEPLAERREELKEFIETHPSHVPLHFVKTPLCLLPQGWEHLCLDVGYVAQGTMLTFNHEISEEITVDTFSNSENRENLKMLRGHPYRWLCRTCNLLPLCRFERVDWNHKYFEPNRDQKPSPFLTLSATDVLSRLDAKPEIIENVEKTCTALKHLSFPEEKIINSITNLQSESIKVKDVYVHKDPILTFDLSCEGQKVQLHLAPPEKVEETTEMDAVIDIFDIRILNKNELSDEVIGQCRNCISQLEFPEAEGFTDENWFDGEVAWLYRCAWKHFGKGLWTGCEGLSEGWSTQSVHLSSRNEFLIRLASPEGLRTKIVYRTSPPQESSDIQFDGTIELTHVPDRSDQKILAKKFLSLVKSISARTKIPTGSVPEISANSIQTGFGLFFSHQKGWNIRKAESGGETSSSYTESLCIHVKDKKSPQKEYIFNVSKYQDGQHYFQRVGDYVLWYSHSEMTRPAELFSRMITASMKALGGVEFSANNQPKWALILEKVVSRVGLEKQFSWTMEWKDN